MMRENLQPSLLNAINSHPVAFAESAHKLTGKLRTTLSRMRVRMNNMEQVLGQTADENLSLKQQAMQLETQLQLSSNANHLAVRREQALMAQLSDLEAQLAAYRRQSMADRKEIDALKDQLFA